MASVYARGERLWCSVKVAGRWVKERTPFHVNDLARLGYRPRRVHDLRRTFISLALADGARKDVLRWITHGPEGDIVDLYTTLPVVSAV